MTNTEPLYSRDWLDVVRINFRQAPPGYVSWHVWKHPFRCTLVTFKSDLLQDPAFPILRELRDRAYLVWDKQEPVTDETCPVCASLLRLSRRLWQGRAFCNVCGTGLE